MIGTIALSVVVIALLTERFYSNRAHDEEVLRLTQAVVAKHAGEVAMMDQVWNDAPREPIHYPDPLGELEGYEGQAGLS